MMDVLDIGSSFVHLMHLCCAKFFDSHSHACLQFFCFVFWHHYVMLISDYFSDMHTTLTTEVWHKIWWKGLAWIYWLEISDLFLPDLVFSGVKLPDQYQVILGKSESRATEWHFTCTDANRCIQCDGGSADGECSGRTYMSSMWTHTRTMCHIISSRSCNPSY